MNALPPGDEPTPGQPEDDVQSPIADADRISRDRASLDDGPRPSGAQLIADLDQAFPDASPIGSGLLWTVAGDDTVPNRRASDYVAPTLADLLARTADFLDVRAHNPMTSEFPEAVIPRTPVLVQFSSRLLTDETDGVKTLARQLLGRASTYGVIIDVTRPADELLDLDEQIPGPAAPGTDEYGSGMSSLVTQLLAEIAGTNDQLWIVTGDFDDLLVDHADCAVATFHDLLAQAQSVVDARLRHPDQLAEATTLHVAFSLAVLGNSTPADRAALTTLAEKSASVQVILRPLVSVRPTGNAVEGEPTDTWTVTDRRGVELVRVEGTTIREAGRKARTYPQVQAADQPEGEGFTLRRLRTNELGTGMTPQGTIDPASGFRPVDPTRLPEDLDHDERPDGSA